MSITNINQEQFERPMSQSNVNQNHASNPTHCPCGKNSIFGYPPSIPDLIRDFPDVVPDFSIRRDQPRCRSCDYRASMNRYQNWWSDVNKYMVSVSKALHKEYPGDTAMTLRQEGVPGAEDYNARFWLDYRKEVLKEQANRYTEAWKFIAWIPFWSIWGKPVGHKDIVWPEPPARQPLFGGELLFGGLPLDGQQLADDQLLFSADPGLFAGEPLPNDQLLFSSQPLPNDHFPFNDPPPFDENLQVDERQVPFSEQPLASNSESKMG